jgi:prepilin-type N-terminal cleavage/methylation domain-containing protein
MKKSASGTGFTLIELLIVIALLGALAVGLLATIDPFEQLKKGRDTSMRNTVSEFYNANLRLYATKAAFPVPLTAGFTGRVYPDLNLAVTALVNAGELKDRFLELAGTGNLYKIFVSSTSPEHVAVCFQPESKSFQVDPNTVYDSTGNTAGLLCKSSGSAGGTDCFFCIQ